MVIALRLLLLGVFSAAPGLWFGMGCAREGAAPERIDRPVTAHVPAPRTVLVVSLDGLAPRALRAVDAPTLERLAREGASARVARTGQPPSTLPSHTSMISGLPVEVHGVDWNDYDPSKRAEVRSVYDVCAERQLRCGLFAGKPKFAHLAEAEPGVERFVLRDDAEGVLDAALAWLAEREPDFALIHLPEIDRVGHREGWDGAEQRAAIEAIDAKLGAFLARAEELAPRPLAVIVTADHGGDGHSHRGESDAVVRIPWIAWGDGVPAGTELDEVSIMDTAPTALSLLGVDSSLLDGRGRAPF